MKAILFLSSLLIAFSAQAKIDTTKSKFQWTAGKVTGDKHTGIIPVKSGDLKMKDGKIIGGEVVMDMKAFTVTDIESEKYNKKFITHVSGPDFFQVEKYPTATLKIKEQVGNNKIKGDLTIKDKTQPVEVTFTKKGETFSGKFSFDRTKFGVIYGSGNFFKELTADKVIKDKVDLDFQLVESK